MVNSDSVNIGQRSIGIRWWFPVEAAAYNLIQGYQSYEASGQMARADRAALIKEWYRRLKRRKRNQMRNQMPERKDAERKRRQTPEYLEYRRKYRQIPEVKEQHKWAEFGRRRDLRIQENRM